MGEEDFAKHREAQKRLSDLEEVPTARVARFARIVSLDKAPSELYTFGWCIGIRFLFFGILHT